jgi:hypothetical protein
LGGAASTSISALASFFRRAGAGIVCLLELFAVAAFLLDFDAVSAPERAAAADAPSAVLLLAETDARGGFKALAACFARDALGARMALAIRFVCTSLASSTRGEQRAEAQRRGLRRGGFMKEGTATCNRSTASISEIKRVVPVSSE